MDTNPNTFARYPLDRANVQRKAPGFLADCRRSADARIMLVQRHDLVMETNAGLAWLALPEAGQHGAAPDEIVFLGLQDGAPRFAASMREGADLSLTHELVPFREAIVRLKDGEDAIAGHAHWLLDWHRRHRYCARYGDKTIIADGGMKRINPKSETEHFPRTDPVAIVLPICGDEVCLGRGPHFPPGSYSAFAGFMEPCETLEVCAAREVLEETGLVLRDVEYVFSQPWPFPSSLMVGFLGYTDEKALTLDPDEIEDARWFGREDIIQMLNGEDVEGIRVPPRFAIAHQLLKVWADR